MRPITNVRRTGYAVLPDYIPMESTGSYDPPLDPGIAEAVVALRQANVETFESCQGGLFHAYPEPTVRFHGDQAEGLRALAAALNAKLQVRELRRVWPVNDGEPTGPWWELTFRSTTANESVTR